MSNGASATGQWAHSPQEEYWHFDRLPPALRAALRNAPTEYSAKEIRVLLMQGMSEEQILKLFELARNRRGL